MKKIGSISLILTLLIGTFCFATNSNADSDSQKLQKIYNCLYKLHGDDTQAAKKDVGYMRELYNLGKISFTPGKGWKHRTDLCGIEF